MRKIFNLRAIFLAFVGLFAGIYFSVFVLSWAIVPKIFLAVLFAAVFGLCFSKIAFFKFRKVAILIVLCSLLVGFIYSVVKIEVYNKNLVDDELSISAQVTDKIKTYDTCQIISLKNVKSDDKELSGGMSLTVYTQDGQEVKAGDVLYFTAHVKSYALKKSGVVNASIEKSGVKYFASVNYDDITKNEGKINFFEKVRISSRKLILENTKNENVGNLIYSVLFGDKTYLSNDIYETFSLSGTAHLLAVSGLHVAFIVAIIMVLLGLTKMKKWPKFTIICAFLVGYNFLCGFTSSVLRASIMTVFLLLSYLFGEKYDALTSLGTAGILILIFKPLMAFDLGFQLSFGSVFGIIVFAGKLGAYFEKIKIPKVIAQSMAVCVASSIGTLPFTAIYFHKLAYIGIISNVLVIPLFGIIYSLTFLILIISLIFPVCAKAYVISEIGFLIVCKICSIFAMVASIRITRISLAVLLLYPLSMLISEFAFIEEKVKKCLALILASCFSVIFASSLIPESINKTAFAKLETNANVLINKNDEVLIVTQNFGEYEIKKSMDYLYENNLDYSLVGIVVTDKANDLKDVYDFASKNKKINIYINTNNVIDQTVLSQNKNIIVKNGGDGFSVGKFEIMFYDVNFNDYTCATSIYFDDFCTLFLNHISSAEAIVLNYVFENSEVSICVCNKFENNYNKLNFKISKFVASKSSVESSKEIVLTNENVNAIYFLNQKLVEEKDEIC